MLNIFYGRENLDKAGFMFENIKGKTLLIVPDQYTLEAERDAFFYLKKKALIDMDVMTFSRMSETILSKTGGSINMVGREGRQMLLTKIVREQVSNFEVFKGSAGKMEFISLIHDLIADFKQHNTDPQKLREAIEEIKEDGLLRRKLNEVLTVFEEYEKYTEDKYFDNEDYISYYISKIGEADFIKESDIWIYGFDSFTEKNIAVIAKLTEHAKSVNAVLTYDDSGRDKSLFDIGKFTIDRLKKACVEVNVVKVPASYMISNNEDIAMLESELYAMPFENSEQGDNIKIIQASNPYNEAASAAIYILSLVREKGYRYKDIALISNDIESVGELYKRVFAEYGIRLFIDNKRGVLHHPAVAYIMALMDVIGGNFQRDDVLKLIKTGMVCSCDGDGELIEIYTGKYNIRGSQWKKDFVKGISRYSEEELAHINEIRKNIIEPVEEFLADFKEAETVFEKVRALYEHLESAVNLPKKTEDLVKKQEEMGMLETAEETAQIWNTISNILQQMVDIIGDEKVGQKEFGDILTTGLEAVEIGVIPPAADGLIMGTMQRTRRGHIKATVITGASEGILPAQQDDGGILNEDERLFLNQQDINICKLAQVRAMEETMAIYRNIAKTENELYISYSVSDNSGSSVEPSNIFEKIREIFKNVPVEKDFYTAGDFENLIVGKEATKNNLISAMLDISEGINEDERWQQIYNWFAKREDVETITDAILSSFGEKNITKEQVEKLFKKETSDVYSLSPSRLEKFGNCPFGHFLSYGLRPEENREYIIGAPESGTVYHECIMKMSEYLSEDKEKWQTITREESDSKVSEIIEEIGSGYMEGIMKDGPYEEYRSQRIFKVCSDSVWMAISQVREGHVTDMRFEVAFGRNGDIPPMVVNTSDKNVIIEGKIDRWDVLPGDYSKIIDYKSGSDKYVEKEARTGIKLQLFIYLMATLNNGVKPGGAFYFHLDEAVAKNAGDATGEIAKQYKMHGFVVDDENVLKAIDNGDKKSNVISRGKNNLLGKEDFDQLLEDIKEKITDMSEKLTQGDVGIKPKKVGDKISCTYCPYKGICKFDLSIEECRYNMV